MNPSILETSPIGCPVPARSYGRAAAYVLLLIAAWLATRPYEGIVLDAQVYALQALVTIDAFPLSNDLFLRYGSQNSFTLFPHLAAPVVEAIGIEAAAAAFTVVAGALLLIVGGVLAAGLSGTRPALLSVGLLITVPGWYGAGEVLRYDEMYLNARVPAEVLAVLALALVARRREVFAAISALAAVAMHPVMGAAVVGVLALLAVNDFSPPGRKEIVVTLVTIGGVLLVWCAAFVLSSGTSAEQAQWIQMMRSRTTFLFLQDWRARDWVQTALGLATLLIASTSLEHKRAKVIAGLLALVGVVGLGTAALASMSDHFELLLLLQSWRWTWLGRFVAVVLLPLVVWRCWQAGTPGRATALLLASGWALTSNFGGLIAVLAALLWFLREHLDGATSRTVLRGAWTIVAVTVTVLAVTGAQALVISLDTNAAPDWVQRVVNFAGVPGPMMGVVTAAWFATFSARPIGGTLSVALLSLLALTGLVPYNMRPALEPRYSEARFVQFSEWRRVIPPAAEVLWHEEPVAVWALLRRQSFMSGSQSAGLLYSRGLTPEYARRAEVLSPLASPGWWTMAAIEKSDEPRTLTLDILERICQEPELGYVVDRTDLGPYLLRIEWPSPGQPIYLYDCRMFRQGRGQ